MLGAVDPTDQLFRLYAPQTKFLSPGFLAGGPSNVLITSVLCDLGAAGDPPKVQNASREEVFLQTRVAPKL